MPAFQINDDEWGALAEEPAELFKLYCAIRRVMDYRTGVAGKSRRISEQMLREVLYVAPLPGRHAPPEVTRQKVRSLLKRLEAIGIAMPVGPLVFELPLASCDGPSKTGATKEQPEQQPYEQPPENEPEPNSNVGFVDDSVAGTTIGESPDAERNNLPPVSGKSPTTLSARGYFAMLDGWEPNPRTWGATALRNAIPTAIDADALNEFRSYWIARPEKEQSQAQWEHALAQSLKRQLRQAQAGGYTHGSANTAAGHRPARQRPLSAVDRVKRAGEELERAVQAVAEGAEQALAQDDRDLRPPLDVEFRRIS